MADTAPLAPDVMEVATLNATAAGVGVDDDVRAALLVHAAPSDPHADDAGEDLPARVERAVRTAPRIRAETRAVNGQTRKRPRTTGRSARRPTAHHAPARTATAAPRSPGPHAPSCLGPAATRRPVRVVPG